MGRSVLIVDDDPDIVSFLEEVIEVAGFTSVATSGAAALAIAHEQQPALILLDLQMPGMAGDEICRRLKRDPATAAIPVIMMSALDRLTATASQVPADDRLPKPFALAQLLERIHYWVTNSPRPSDEA